MDPNVNAWLQLAFRWLHIVAGVIWVGHLYFFTFVNAPFSKTMDAPTKRAVVPELLPRALYWFRWGAAWTWLSGMMLLGLVYYMGGGLFEGGQGDGAKATGLLVGTFVLLGLYDVVLKRVPNVVIASAINLIILGGVVMAYEHLGHFSGRAIYIHAGAILGTIMAMNVLMRIWPAQKKIIAAVKEGLDPDPALVALAAARSRQNAYMSIPLLFFMISNHYPQVYGSLLSTAYLFGALAIGFAVTRLLLGKAAKVGGM